MSNSLFFDASESQYLDTGCAPLADGWVESDFTVALQYLAPATTGVAAYFFAVACDASLNNILAFSMNATSNGSRGICNIKVDGDTGSLYVDKDCSAKNINICTRFSWINDLISATINGAFVAGWSPLLGDMSGLTAADWANASSRTIWVGALNFNGSGYFTDDSHICNVRVWNRGLSDAEMLEVSCGKMNSIFGGLILDQLMWGEVIDRVGTYSPTNHGGTAATMPVNSFGGF